MTNGFIAVYTAFLYYCCLVCIARYIFCYKSHRVHLLLSFAIFGLFFTMSLIDDVNIVMPANIVILLAQFILLKLSYEQINLFRLILTYILLNCLNIIISAVVVVIIPCEYQHVDILITSIYAVVCIAICVSKLKTKVQQILIWTPKYILVICALLMFIASGIATMVSTFSDSPFPSVLSGFVQIMIPILMLVICAVVPMIFVIAISNTKLKSLTSDYEQQIRAQAAHYKELADANRETRRFRHDFANMRIAVEQLCSVGEYDKAMEVLRRQGEQLRATSPGFETGNGIADALLTDKHEKTKQHGGCIIFEGMVAPDAPEPTDLCVILGNTLDNAIEACAGLPEDVEKVITVSSVCCNGFWFLTVRNPIAAPVKISGGSIATTKENKTLHGFGLYSLNSVVRKYDGNVNLSADEHTFTAEIELSLRPQR